MTLDVYIYIYILYIIYITHFYCKNTQQIKSSESDQIKKNVKAKERKNKQFNGAIWLACQWLQTSVSFTGLTEWINEQNK